MKLSELLRHLRENDCSFHREGGKHALYRNDETGAQSPIPRHNEIATKTAWKICDELGIPRPRGR